MFNHKTKTVKKVKFSYSVLNLIKGLEKEKNIRNINLKKKQKSCTKEKKQKSCIWYFNSRDDITSSSNTSFA